MNKPSLTSLRTGLAGLVVAARMAGCDSLQLLARPDAPTLDAFCRATGFVEGPGGFVRPLRKKG